MRTYDDLIRQVQRSFLDALHEREHSAREEAFKTARRLGLQESIAKMIVEQVARHHAEESARLGNR